MTEYYLENKRAKSQGKKNGDFTCVFSEMLVCLFFFSIAHSQ